MNVGGKEDQWLATAASARTGSAIVTAAFSAAVAPKHLRRHPDIADSVSRPERSSGNTGAGRRSDRLHTERGAIKSLDPLRPRGRIITLSTGASTASPSAEPAVCLTCEFVGRRMPACVMRSVGLLQARITERRFCIHSVDPHGSSAWDIKQGEGRLQRHLEFTSRGLSRGYRDGPACEGLSD
jgi:hypothetical protein